MKELDELFEKGASLVKETRESVIGSIGKIVATLTLLVVGIVIFTEVSFVKMSAEAFSCELSVLLLGAVVMYYSMEAQGERLALECDEGKACLSALRERIERIRGEDVLSLAHFCDRYAKEEAERRRGRYLLRHGLSAEDLAAHLRGEACDKRRARILRIAARIRPTLLTPSTLLSTGTRTKTQELIDPESKKRSYLFWRLLPSILCMSLTVSIAVSTKGELTAAVIAAGVLKLATLIGICARGYLQGYMYGRETLIPWIKTKTRLLDAFLAEGRE